MRDVSGGEGRVSGVLMVDLVGSKRSKFQRGIEEFCLNILLWRNM